MGFDTGRMQDALGIAGSLACGLDGVRPLRTGAMVKRLHLGRAARERRAGGWSRERRLYRPVSVLEGARLSGAFCGNEYDATELTRGLGDSYATRSIMLKRFPATSPRTRQCRRFLDLRAEHDYGAADVASIQIAGNDKMARVNNIPAPPTS